MAAPDVPFEKTTEEIEDDKMSGGTESRVIPEKNQNVFKVVQFSKNKFIDKREVDKLLGFQRLRNSSEQDIRQSLFKTPQQ